MYNECCVLSCNSRRKDVIFYRFPKSEIGLKIWLQLINCDTLRSMSFLDLQKHFVCQKHFEKRFLALTRVRSRLRVGAYPTLFTKNEIVSGVPQQNVHFLDHMKNATLTDNNNLQKRKHEDHCYYKVEIIEKQPRIETESSVVNETNESVSTTSVTPQPEGDSDKNTASKQIHRRISCDTISDSVKSLGTCEDPLAIESEEVADHTVSDSESYLEDIDEEISEWSDGIIDEYAQKWEPILKNGLLKRVQDEINSNYLFCKNLPSSKPPTLNIEIANLLTEEIKIRDNKLVNKQSQLGHALAALGKAMSGLRTNTMETSDMLETLNDVGELIADLHYLETEARRSLIIQELDKSFAEPLKDPVRDEYLFGRDIGELVKPPEVKTTASSITPRMISTFLNKKKVQSPVAPPTVRQSTNKILQKIMKRPATLTPVYQITKKLRQSIETSLTTLRTCEEELSSDTGTAAPDPDPDPDSTTTDPTAAITFTQQNNIQVYDENCQRPLSPRQWPLTVTAFTHKRRRLNGRRS